MTRGSRDRGNRGHLVARPSARVLCLIDFSSFRNRSKLFRAPTTPAGVVVRLRGLFCLTEQESALAHERVLDGLVRPKTQNGSVIRDRVHRSQAYVLATYFITPFSTQGLSRTDIYSLAPYKSQLRSWLQSEISYTCVTLWL